MIKRIASCPYCRAGEIAYDYEAMEVVLNPDGARQEPCDHLVCIQGFYCKGEIHPGESRKVGFAQVHWNHPLVAAVAPEELFRFVRGFPVPELGREVPPADLPFRMKRLQIREERHLSADERIRWFDQVGWDNASDEELPYEEYKLQGYIVFARSSAELLPLVGGEPACPGT